MRFAWLMAVSLTLVMAASGCTSEPSLKEAAAELQKDAQRLEKDDVFKNPLMKLRILQRPDKDIPCDKDKFKRVLRVTADDERKTTDVDSHLDQAEGVMAGTLVHELGYKLEYPFSEGDAEEGRFIHGLKEVGVLVAVYVAPEAPTWRLHAETSCLPK
ncbi:hypothetical protein [Streptosporangium sp. 'caverna']|uniref:hypothetical protein n=1 Tax=Streptosporangium sp. 'caverna' TaxID=2202249 RepID=UPI0013A6E4DE|nr:hypothetical protein [Streptosporangium sp. 'caverna']